MWPFNKKQYVPEEKYVMVTDGKEFAIKNTRNNKLVSTLTGNEWEEGRGAAICWTSKQEAEKFLRRLKI